MAALPARALGQRRGGHPRWRQSRWWRGVVIAVLVVLVAAVADGTVVLSRVTFNAVPSFTSTTSGETWIIVGSDNRAYDSPGYNVPLTAADGPGDHADINLVIHQYSDKTSVLSLPRDLFLTPTSGTPNRLTVLLTQGPAYYTSALCNDLGIPPDHVILIRMATFAGIVDVLGGIDITLPYPFRDLKTRSSLPAGTSHLDGNQALAYVRSRQPQQFIDGKWVAVSDTQGAQHRTNNAGVIFRLVADKLKSNLGNPIQLQRLAWAASNGLVVDSRSTLASLPTLTSAANQPAIDVPVATTASPIVVMPDAATYATLATAGYIRGDCHMG